MMGFDFFSVEEIAAAFGTFKVLAFGDSLIFRAFCPVYFPYCFVAGFPVFL
jgi:hypothetical protein